MGPFCSSSECPALSWESTGLLLLPPGPFLLLTSVEVLSITKLTWLLMYRQYQTKWNKQTNKQKKRRTFRILNKLSCGLEVLLIPVSQETINDIVNTARVAVHGAQGPKITLPKPLLEILTGTVATHCYNKISFSSHPGVIAVGRSFIQNVFQRTLFRDSWNRPHFFFPFKILYFLLKYSWFTMLC